MQFNNYVPPLRSWPPEAFIHEPAHGYFIRLAARNGAHSTAVFADSVGLNGRNPNIEELLDFCLRFPLRNRDFMIAASPRVDGGNVIINGQKFMKGRDWSIRKLRVCSACLAEARYHRNWWDLTIITRCPIHDRPLLDGDGHSGLRWWYPEVGQTPSGTDLITYNAEPKKAHDQMWDRYVLGRLGVIEKTPNDRLDQCDMRDVIDIAEFIGRAMASGWMGLAPKRPKFHSSERRDLIALGFPVLHAGGECLENFLTKYLNTNTSLSGSDRYGLFGWFATSLVQLKDNPILQELQIAMDTVAAVVAKVHRKRGEGRTGSGRGPQTLKDLTKRFGIGAHTLLRIVIQLGLSRKLNSAQDRYWFDEGAVATLSAYLDRLISIDDAMIMLGTSRKKFLAAISANGVRAVMRKGGRRYFDILDMSVIKIEAGRPSGLPTADLLCCPSDN